MRWALAALGAALVLGLCAPGAWASTTTINFSTPVIPGTNSPQAGPGLGDQYQSEGVVFAASFPAVGSQVPDPCGGQLYRDTADAYSGDQVAFSFCQAHGEDFDQDANIEGEIPDLTDAVSVYAGAPAITINGIKYYGGGQVTTLTGYSTDGQQIAQDTVTVGTQADTLLSISVSGEQIAYFSVSGPVATSAPLEIGELSFQVPATPPPPQIAINPVASGFTEGFQGQALSVPVTIDRYAGADDPITLAISGLPSGVTLTGGQTIAADSESTTLTFSIAPNAPAAHTQYTLTASTADANAPPAEQGTFTVAAGLVVNLGQSSVTVAACSTASVLVATQQYAPGTASLTYTAHGDTTGLTASLSGTVSGQATLSLASNGTGGSGTATYTFTYSDGNVPPQTATLTVNRVGLTAQGLYVTQGIQPDDGSLGLVPSGIGASGNPYQGDTLVAAFKTVVRLYANSNGSTPVSALLYGYEDGKPLPGSPLEPDYGPLNSSGQPETNLPSASTGSDQIVSDGELESNANAYTFTLPYRWTQDYGTNVQLVGQVQPTDVQQSGGGCHANDSFTLNNLSFQDVGNDSESQEQLMPVALTVNGNYPPPASQVFQYTQAVLPISGGLVVFPYYTSIDVSGITTVCNTSGSNCVESPNGTTNTNQALSLVQNAYSGNNPFNYHVVGVAVNSGGVTASVPGDYSAVGYNTSTFGGERPLTGVTHEVFHQFGLVHASNECGGGEDNDGDDHGQVGEIWYPFANPPAGSGETEESPPTDGIGQLDGIGLDTTAEPYQFIAPNVPQTVVSGTYNLGQDYDLMSYCAGVRGGGDPGDWVAPRNWEQLIQNINNDTNAADVASAARADRATDPLAATAQLDPGHLAVSGIVSSTSYNPNPGVNVGTASLSITDVGPQVGSPLPNGTSADSFTLMARGSHGQLLGSVPMAATTGGHDDELPQGPGRTFTGPTYGPVAIITGELPAKGVDSVQIAEGGKVMATRTRPAKAPRVKVLAPRRGARVGKGSTVLVRWRTTNPEHLALTAIVDYSRDGGRTWRTIFVGPNKDHVTLPSFYFAASRKARVRVRMSDGFNQPDALSGTFVALGAPPQVTITTKLAPKLLLAGDAAVPLTGQAVDQLAQMLKGRSLKWYDGPFLIGTGAAISAGPLPPGTNHIRLLARDPSGRTGSATISVRVSPVSLPFLKLKLPKSVGRKLKQLTFTASSSTPATLTIGRHSFALGMKRRQFKLAIKRGRTPLLLQLSVTANGVRTPFAALLTR